MVTCGLCGFSYTPGGEACRSASCPLARGGCQIAHCPRCGYATPSEARGLAGWIARLLSRNEHVPAAASRLSDVKPGQRVVIDHVEAPPDITSQLTVLGFTHGTRATVQQRFPAYVVDVDGAEVALERSAADAVWVTREPVP
jgi:Fe2+ transport system protein FeoA